MTSMISVRELRKTYASGHDALKGVSLEIEQGEILALLGPNGAGKTTMISIICGIATMSSGAVSVGGHDVINDFRAARKLIGLVPQEVNLEPFERVINTVRFSRGLFGKPKDDAFLEKILRQLSLWDKKDSRIMELSGGMKRRLMIARALVHEPKLLILEDILDQFSNEAAKSIIDFLCQPSHSWAIVTVSKNAYWKTYCKEIIHLNDGEIQSK